jgi:hypothetical protein
MRATTGAVRRDAQRGGGVVLFGVVEPEFGVEFVSGVVVVVPGAGPLSLGAVLLGAAPGAVLSGAAAGGVALSVGALGAVDCCREHAEASISAATENKIALRFMSTPRR